jgi:hypothetical protein
MEISSNADPAGLSSIKHDRASMVRPDVVVVVTEARHGDHRMILTSEIRQFPEEVIQARASSCRADK